MFRIVYSIENIIKQKKNMGCTDSQVSSIDNKQQEKPKKKAIRFAPGIEDDTQVMPQKDSPQIKKSKSKSKSKGKGKHHQADAQGNQKQQKQNTVKVKKARNLRHHPEHEKFIEDIMSQSRAKVASEYPQIPKSPSGFIKPVVEYAPAYKGQILPNQGKLKEQNRWNFAITQRQCHHKQHLQFNQSYVSINETVKSPYRQKEIEKRLNGIRNGRFQQSQSGQLARYRAAPFEEMQCTYLQ